MLKRATDHLRRLRRQFGQPVRLGATAYRVRGYTSNLLEIDSPHEREMDVVIARVLQREGHFIDVGVNLGQTLGKVLAVDPRRPYLGFEPQVAACATVVAFLADNGIGSARVLPLGLSDGNGLREFFSAGAADTAAGFFEDSANMVRMLVPVRVGDEVLREAGIDRVAAIKIDVEGAELAVIRGLSRTIAASRAPVIFEVLPNFEGVARVPVAAAVAQRRRAEAAGIAAAFAALDYRILQIHGDGTEVPVTGFELDDPAAFAGTNYIARPG